MAKAFGICEAGIAGDCYQIIPKKSAYKSYGNFVWQYKNHKDKNPDKDYSFDITINFTGKILRAKDGVIEGKIFGNPEVIMETHYQKRKLNQNSTYWGILHFMFWVQNGRKPIGNEKDPYNDALMEMYAPEIIEDNPLIKGEKIKRKKRQTEMNTVEFARLIEGALAWLASMDIPRNVQNQIGGEMKNLWRSWYEWKNAEEGIMSQLEPDEMSYETYAEIHPVCELTGEGGSVHDPVVRMHLVANLQSTPYYDQPWSYIRAKQSLHQRQHNEGWEAILEDYPHIKKKWERAQTMATNRNVEIEDRKEEYQGELEIF